MRPRGPVTRVHAGIDEAGFGPLLGPLTLGWAAYRAPSARTDPWRRLSRVVTKDAEPRDERVAVADSKVVFSRTPAGEKRLETTALAFLGLADPFGRWPASGLELVELGPSDLRRTEDISARHPWYRELATSLPAWVDRDVLSSRSQRLAREAERRGISFVDAGVRFVPVGELNSSYDRTENKSLTLWHEASAIIGHLWRLFAREGLHLVVDRQGGRFHYTELVRERFPGARVEVVKERPALAEYVVCKGERRMRLQFATRGEERSFGCALGSCLAKYGREVAMGAFNRYFESLQPGLRPTAGYTTDGRRWLADAKLAVRRAELEPRVLVRER